MQILGNLLILVDVQNLYLFKIFSKSYNKSQKHAMYTVKKIGTHLQKNQNILKVMILNRNNSTFKKVSKDVLKNMLPYNW